MDRGLLAKLESHGSQGFAPVTFLERGVSLPLTTPLLLGARVRPIPGAKDGALEVVLPNPAGGEGVYILPWSSVPAFCTPSLHDRLLWDEVTALGRPSPAGMRHAARKVAADGAAGRDAAAAAEAAVAAREERRMRTHYGLLLRAIRQAERPLRDPPPEREDARGLAVRARAALGAALPALSGSPELLTALEELAEVMEPGGLPDAPGGRPDPAPLPILLAGLSELGEAMAALPADRSPIEAACAAVIAAAVETTRVLADRDLAWSRGLLSDLPALVARWLRDPDAVCVQADRPDWLLDGWEPIVALWRLAGRDALPDMALLVPVVPAEAYAAWSTERAEAPPVFRSRVVAANQDWQTGRILELQRRAERIRAIAA